MKHQINEERYCLGNQWLLFVKLIPETDDEKRAIKNFIQLKSKATHKEQGLIYDSLLFLTESSEPFEKFELSNRIGILAGENGVFEINATREPKKS